MLHEAHIEFGRRIAKMTSADETDTFDKLCDQYMLRAFPEKKSQSRKDTARYVEVIREVFGNNAVDQVQTKHIYQFYDALQQNRGLNTCNKIMETLSDILTHAVRWGLIADHPMIGGKFKKKKPVKAQRYIEDWEIDEALTVAPLLIKAYINLKLLTGLRATDMLSLRWQDVREDGLFVAHSKTEDSTGKAQVFSWTDDLVNAIEDAKRLKPKVGSAYLLPHIRVNLISKKISQ